MARIFKDVTGRENNLDDLLNTGTISFDYDVDVLDNSVIRYYVNHSRIDGMDERKSSVVVTREYYDVVKKIVEQEQK